EKQQWLGYGPKPVGELDADDMRNEIAFDIDRHLTRGLPPERGWVDVGDLQAWARRRWPREWSDQLRKRRSDPESRSAGCRSGPSVSGMASIESVTLEVADPAAAERFYTAAFGPDTPVRVRASDAPTTGFRGFTLSLTVSQPGTVRGLVDSALEA